MVECARPLAVLFSVIFGLSPVLSTLTASFSSDTVYTTSTLLLVLHLFCHGYTGQKRSITTYITIIITWLHLSEPPTFSAVAMNAVVFASLLLASRLPSTQHVFGFVSYSFLLFALFPVVRYYLRLHVSFFLSMHLLSERQR